MPPFFGRNKPLRVAADNPVDSQPKSSVGKRRRWRRPRRLRKETTAESEVSPVAFLEEREDASSRTNAHFLTTPTLKAVLLLLDPATRRFELLQLEFDYCTARVTDLLAQIPVSATEEALRNGTYTGLVGPDGVAYSPSQWLSECWGPTNQVVVALPESLTLGECVCMARPILMVPNVVATLNSCGVDVSGWREEDDVPVPMARNVDADAPQSPFRFLWIQIVLYIILQMIGIYFSELHHPPMRTGSWLLDEQGQLRLRHKEDEEVVRPVEWRRQRERG